MPAKIRNLTGTITIPNSVNKKSCYEKETSAFTFHS